MPSPIDLWTPYSPTPQAPWNLSRVVLLHRRCGFAATWDELQRDLGGGPDATPQACVDRLLRGEARLDVPSDFEETSRNLARIAIDQQGIGRLQAWWIFRMVSGPDPLGEQLTLLWHDHFATSQAKVQDVALMHRQNEVLRSHARAPFGRLLSAMLHDPALLSWLDAPANVKAKPNENLSRELMELFTLGVGHYSETDVKEAARVLSGWSVRRDRFFDDTEQHDPGDKTVLGHGGALGTPEFAEILLAHPATSERLAARIAALFLGEEVASPDHLRALAGGLREHDLDVGWAVATVLRSSLFFSDANLESRVASPIEFVVGLARGLELDRERVSTLLLAQWVARMGQELFLPPNVGGWRGGRAWLDTQGVVQRANFVNALVNDGLVPRARDWLSWVRSHGRADTVASLLDFIGRILCGRSVAVASDGRDGSRSAAVHVAALLVRPEFLLV